MRIDQNTFPEGSISDRFLLGILLIVKLFKTHSIPKITLEMNKSPGPHSNLHYVKTTSFVISSHFLLTVSPTSHTVFEDLRNICFF